MKKQWKIIIPALIVLSMLAAACGGGNAGSSGGTSSPGVSGGTASSDDGGAAADSEQDSAPAASENTLESEAAAPEPEGEIILTFGADGGSMEDGIHYDFSVINEIAKKTGVRFDFVNIDRDKFRVLAAGQDLPDIFNIYDASMIESLIENGILLGLNDLIAEYGPNVAEGYAMTMKHQNLIFGDTYLFPYDIYDEPPERHIPERNGGSIKARYDLYKEIGSPEITDKWNGYFDVLAQMQEYAREKYDDNSIYATSSWVDWGIWPFICVYPFSNGYGDLYDVNQMVNCTTNEIEDNLLAADGVFWEGVKYMRDLYSRGLFDPEGLTQKYSQYADKVQSGKILVTFASWLQPNDDLMVDGATFVILPNSVGKVLDITPRLLPMGNRFSDALAVNTKCKHADRFMQMMNWTNSTEGKRTMANGVQGETWDYINGVPQYIGIFKDEYLYSPNCMEYHNVYPSGVYGDNSFMFLRVFGSNGPNGFADDGYPYFLMNEPEFKALSANDAERAFAKDFGFNYPGEVYMQWVKEGKMDYSPIYLTMAAQLFGTVDDEISVTVAKTMQHFEANVSKVIMAPTEEDFEKEKATIISDLLDMGLGEASAAIAKQFEDAKALVEQFAN